MRYLVQDKATRKYRLGVRVLDLGLAALNSMELRDVALPFMEQLCEQSGHTVNMAVLDGSDIVYIERVRSRSGIDLHLYVGSRLPSYCTSMGKVLLAFLPEAELLRIIDGIEFLPRGPRTITSRRELLANLEEVRRLGVAVNDEELARGLRSIAAPVFGQHGSVVAAVNMAVHAMTHSFDEVMQKLAPLLLDATSQISEHLGYRGHQVLGNKPAPFAVIP
jgi:IclR family pca regulon transcriptional regulator